MAARCDGRPCPECGYTHTPSVVRVGPHRYVADVPQSTNLESTTCGERCTVSTVALPAAAVAQLLRASRVLLTRKRWCTCTKKSTGRQSTRWSEVERALTTLGVLWLHKTSYLHCFKRMYGKHKPGIFADHPIQYPVKSDRSSNPKV